MLSRNPVSAAVALLIVCLGSPAGAQNLEAGKTPSQLFSQTCSLCHKSARGLLKTVPAGSLAAFLRQHYTTSADMAGMLSAYVLSNGANDKRLGGDNLTRQGREAQSTTTAPETKRSEAKPPSVTGLLEGLFEPRSHETRSPEPRSSEPRSPESRQPEAKPTEVKPVPSEARPEPKPEERRTREASRPDVDGLDNVPGAPKQAGTEGEPPEAQQRGKKLREDKRKPSVSTVKQEKEVGPSVTTKPAEAGKTETGKAESAKIEAVEPTRELQTRPDSVPAMTSAPAGESPQQTAEGRSPNMPVFDLNPPPSEVAPPTPPRPPAGTPAVPISQ